MGLGLAWPWELEAAQMSFTWLELPVDGVGVGVLVSLAWASSDCPKQLSLKGWGWGGNPVEQIFHFCLLWGCRPWSLLIQPSLSPHPVPEMFCGYESMIRQGKGTLTLGEEDSVGLWALMLALLHPECMKGYGRERKKYKSRTEKMLF